MNERLRKARDFLSVETIKFYWKEILGFLGGYLVLRIDAVREYLFAVLNRELHVPLLSALIGLAVAAMIGAIPGWIARRRDRPTIATEAAVTEADKFEPVDVLIKHTPIPVLWRVRKPADDWRDVDPYIGWYWGSVLYGPLCGAETAPGKYCRQPLSEPPADSYPGDAYRFIFQCSKCGASTGDDLNALVKTDDERRRIAIALQAHVQNGGELHTKLELEL